MKLIDLKTNIMNNNKFFLFIIFMLSILLTSCVADDNNNSKTTHNYNFIMEETGNIVNAKNGSLDYFKDSVFKEYKINDCYYFGRFSRRIFFHRGDCPNPIHRCN